MNGTNRRAEFFALEATEYLAELQPLAARADMPDPERLVRGARALRGAALMAGLGTFARAAAALEGVARQVRDHALGWEPHARAAWREGLDTLRGLVSRATSWEAADDRQALTLAERLERVATGQPAAAPSEDDDRPLQPASSLSPGVRAFIARESSLIAGSLLEASRALAPLHPPAALAAVLERMRSLRGVGASSELSPLPELLDAMEMTTRSLLGDIPAPPDVGAVFADAADALSAMAKSVADHGRVVVPPGVDAIAKRLLESFAAEHDVVAIDDLAPDGEPAILQAGTPPSQMPAAPPVALELVGVGDHLLLQADSLERHSSPVARDLRLFVLHRTLTSMPPKSGTGQFVAPLATAITAAIGHGRAAREPDRFLELLREAGRFLVEAGDHPEARELAVQRDRIVHRLDPDAVIVRPAIAAPPPAEPETIDSEVPDQDLVGTPIVAIEALAPEAAPIDDAAPSIDDFAPDPEPVVAIADLAPDTIETTITIEEELTVVSIESLAPDRDGSDELESALPIVPIESLAPDDTITIPDIAPGEPGRLESGFARRSELEHERAAEPPSLDALIGEPPLAIDQLLYRGDRAVARAEEVHAELSGILAEPTVSLERLRPLLDELLDLVPLARDAA